MEEVLTTTSWWRHTQRRYRHFFQKFITNIWLSSLNKFDHLVNSVRCCKTFWSPLVERAIYCTIYRVCQKRGYSIMTIIMSNLNRLAKFFSLEDFLVNLQCKWILNIPPPHLVYVATLPCETLMPAKQAINDKLQGSVATYLMCGGVVNNQIKKGLLLSVWVK